MVNPYKRNRQSAQAPFNSRSFSGGYSRRSSFNRSSRGNSLLGSGMKLFGIAAAVALLPASCAVYNFGTEDNVRFTVKDKERVTTGSGDSVSSKYLVYTNSETFENTDSLFRLKFDSSDLYGQLDEGTTYDATVYGWRVPFLSMYRNIVDVTPVRRERTPAPAPQQP